MRKQDRIMLAHGSGGKLSHDLISKVFLPSFANPILEKLDDTAVFDLQGGRLAFTTDSYVVSPLFFNGGDIGRLALCGTVNDLAMSGAVPRFLSVAFIIEEGFLVEDLMRVLDSMRSAADEAGVAVVTGDTKVVEKGGADGLFINTAGVGEVPVGANISGSNARVGDKIILSGTIGDHGIAIISQREGLSFETDIKSDCAPLNGLVGEMLQVSTEIRAMRDPTRGGLASTLNEIASQSQVAIHVWEEKIPIREDVFGACEMLGFDPLHVANEGKLVAVVAAEKAEEILSAMRKHRYGKDAVVIGEVVESHPGRVLMKTAVGATRIVDMLVGEQLPRIC